jgi:hypothetical protein
VTANAGFHFGPRLSFLDIRCLLPLEWVLEIGFHRGEDFPSEVIRANEGDREFIVGLSWTSVTRQYLS